LIFSVIGTNETEDERLPYLKSLLAQHGVDVNVTLANITPLHFAAGRGYTKMAALLIKKGADITTKVDTQDGYGLVTPAQYAEKKEHVELHYYLLLYEALKTNLSIFKSLLAGRVNALLRGETDAEQKLKNTIFWLLDAAVIPEELRYNCNPAQLEIINPILDEYDQQNKATEPTSSSTTTSMSVAEQNPEPATQSSVQGPSAGIIIQPQPLEMVQTTANDLFVQNKIDSAKDLIFKQLNEGVWITVIVRNCDKKYWRHIANIYRQYLQQKLTNSKAWKASGRALNTAKTWSGKKVSAARAPGMYMTYRVKVPNNERLQ
jgi:hypothetical protein